MRRARKPGVSSVNVRVARRAYYKIAALATDSVQGFRVRIGGFYGCCCILSKYELLIRIKCGYIDGKVALTSWSRSWEYP